MRQDPGKQPLYVFLDGDGQSWLRDGRVSADPTPRHSVALDLLDAEESCAMVISRPCTYGLADSDPLCSPAVWTVERYSSETIESLVNGIEREVPPGQSIVLVGLSGGGLIASHVAERVERVEALVTLGANLDLAAWLAHHHYTREILAHVPKSPFPLRSDLVQIHVLAADDEVSPPALTLDFLGDRARSDTIMLEGADHACCWVREWPSIRRAIQQRILRSTRS